MIKRLLFIILIFIDLTCFSQSSISGIVTDDANSPLPYATVYLSKTTMGVLANQFGVYTINIP